MKAILLAGASALALWATSAYATTEFDFTGSVVGFAVPTDGVYEIDAFGAQGGGLGGGLGAEVGGDVFLNGGVELEIAVGGIGGTCCQGGSGGGGGTWVFDETGLLLVAGGGGGQGFVGPGLQPLRAGQAGTDGGGVLGGTAGSGGGGGYAYGGGGGGGFKSAGSGFTGIGPLSGTGGLGPPSFQGGSTAGFIPATHGTIFVNIVTGGFGGGGGAGYGGGGGGGGYSGGGASFGGGSFIAGSFFNTIALSGVNGRSISSGPPFFGQSAAGLVTITPVPEPASWIEMISGLGFLGYLLRRRMLRGPARA